MNLKKLLIFLMAAILTFTSSYGVLAATKTTKTTKQTQKKTIVKPTNIKSSTSSALLKKQETELKNKINTYKIKTNDIKSLIEKVNETVTILEEKAEEFTPLLDIYAETFEVDEESLKKLSEDEIIVVIERVLDMNDDGIITKDDLKEALKREFIIDDNIDFDKDDIISREEIVKGFKEGILLAECDIFEASRKIAEEHNKIRNIIYSENENLKKDLDEILKYVEEIDLKYITNYTSNKQFTAMALDKRIKAIDTEISKLNSIILKLNNLTMILEEHIEKINTLIEEYSIK
ncbi:hypothetical protein [Caloramator australicus]|uniref:EF-hand domain-containing protein n=1 Tax=Caloramator australicus RC3 TaxID=857293 RepID=I7K957_9CLOT|nr:hypothetical protein [Caloramator australicus]CCJ34130.1 hypothetical protein CAAU_2046 [Caloramator australicus RC3]